MEIWNWRDGSRRIVKHTELDVHAICFSSDGQCIAVGMQNGDVLILNVRTGQWVEKLMGHRNWVGSVAFMPDGMGLISGSEDKTVKFWNMSSLQLHGSGSVVQNCRMKAKDGTEGQEILNFTGHRVCRFKDLHK